jgi:GMP synthase PP-ATPase subunit
VGSDLCDVAIPRRGVAAGVSDIDAGLRLVERLQRSVEVLVWRYSDAGLVDTITVENVDTAIFHSYGTSTIVRSSVVVGHWLKYDAEAAARSTTEMHDFLTAQLAR